MRILALALLAGCQTPITATVPIPVPCIQSIPDRPVTASDEALKAMPDGPLVLTLAADRAVLRGHVDELRALLAPCVE